MCANVESQQTEVFLNVLVNLSEEQKSILKLSCSSHTVESIKTQLKRSAGFIHDQQQNVVTILGCKKFSQVAVLALHVGFCVPNYSELFPLRSTRSGFAVMTAKETLGRFSDAQRHVLQLAADGYLIDDIARIRSCSSVTVQTHLTNMRQALGVKNPHSVVMLMMGLRLIGSTPALYSHFKT